MSICMKLQITIGQWSMDIGQWTIKLFKSMCDKIPTETTDWHNAWTHVLNIDDY